MGMLPEPGAGCAGLGVQGPGSLPAHLGGGDAFWLPQAPPKRLDSPAASSLASCSSRRWDGPWQSKALLSQSFGFKSAFRGAEVDNPTGSTARWPILECVRAGVHPLVGVCTLPRGAPRAPPERSAPLTSSILHLLARHRQRSGVDFL